jgi:hypothetical protein
MKFVSDLRQVVGFLWVLVYSTNKTDCHDITEILLKVAEIFTKLGHMIPLWKGKNPIYFGVITIIPFDNLYRQVYFVVVKSNIQN